MFDNPRVRGLYASLSDGWTYVNAQSHPQIPERVSSAVSRGFRIAALVETPEVAVGSHSRQTHPGRRIGESFIDAARVAVADLVGGRPECVILGASRAQLLGQLAQAMGRQLRLGQEVVLSRIDAPANIEPWVWAADMYGARVRWAEPDLATGALPAWQFSELVGAQTAVVALAAANEYVGTVTDVRAVTDKVHEQSPALCVVDVDAAAPYCVLDIAAMGADVVAVDFVGLGGPAVGALVFRDVSVIRSAVAARGVGAGMWGMGAQDSVRRAQKILGLGGVAEGLLAGVAAAVDHVAGLDDAARGTRRRRLEQSLPQAMDYMRGLARRAVDGLQGLGAVHVIGVDGDFGVVPATFDSVLRAPRFCFFVDGVSSVDVERRLLANGVVAGVVAPGSSKLLERMGVFEEVAEGAHARVGGAVGVDAPGAVAVGLSPHNTAHDVDQLLRVVASLC